MSCVILESDFDDYYDTELKAFDSQLKFIRSSKENMSKANALKFLRSLGYETIKLGPMDNYSDNELVIVYSNPELHNGLGKQALTVDSAKIMYGNKPCAKCYNSSRTYKILQIGYSCYSLEIENDGLKESKLLKCIMIGKGFPGCIDMKYPMYSIDFVRNEKNDMIACDFDACVRLGHIEGIEESLPADMIVKELHKYLVNRQ